MRRSLYDWSIIILLILPIVLGSILFGGVHDAVSLPLLAGIFVAFLMWLVRGILDLRLRKMPVPPGGIATLVLLVYLFFGIAFSEVPYASRMQWMQIAGGVVAYWLWSEEASISKRWRRILAFFLVTVVLICLYAFIQQAHGSNLVLVRHRPSQYGMRASGTYICPNHFAHLLEIALCTSLALILTKAGGVPLRLLAGYALAVGLPSLYLTQSRSGMVAAAVGMLVTVWLISWRRNRRFFFAMLVLLPLVLIFAGVLLWLLSPALRARWSGALPVSPDDSVRVRLLMWRDSLAIIRDAPWFGHGGGSFRWIYEHYKTHSLQNWFRYAHNEYLQVAVEYGIVGLVLFLGVIGRIIVYLLGVVLRSRRERGAYLAAGALGALAATLIHAGFDFNMHIFANMHAMIMLVGCVVGVRSISSENGRSVNFSGRRGLIGWIALVLIAVVLVVETLRMGLEYWFLNSGDRWRAALDYEQARRAYAIAMRLEPGDWRPYLGAAMSSGARCFWALDERQRDHYGRMAMEFYKQAARRNRWEISVYEGLSKVFDSLGDLANAERTLRGAIALTPRDVELYIDLGLLLRLNHRYKEALDIFKKAEELDADREVIRLNMNILRKRIATMRRQGDELQEQIPSGR